MAGLQFNWIEFVQTIKYDVACMYWNYWIQMVKLETSCTVIFPPTVNVLCFVLITGWYQVERYNRNMQKPSKVDSQRCPEQDRCRASSGDWTGNPWRCGTEPPEPGWLSQHVGSRWARRHSQLKFYSISWRCESTI